MTATYTQPLRPPHIAQILCAAFLLLFFLPTTLPAQNGGDGDLYFPPKLRIQASTDESWLFGMLTANIEALSDSTTIMSDRLIFKKHTYVQSIQLLPMIFFDQGSYTIPQHYQRFAGSSDADKYKIQGQHTIHTRAELPWSAELTKYYEVLNVIGKRMTIFRPSCIEIEGGYSTEPGEDETVGKHRADVVKEYLVNVWRIEPERITILPARLMCTTDDNTLRQEEARRVAIHTRNRELLTPVHYQTNFIEDETIAFAVTIDPQMPANEISEIQLLITTDDEVLSKTMVPVNKGSAVNRFIGLWSLPQNIARMESSMTAQALISTHSGTVRGSNIVSIPVQIKEMQSHHSQIDEYGTMQKPLNTNIEPIQFFESSDSCLSAMQEQDIDEQIALIIKKFASRPNNNWTISVTAHGEESDNPEANVERIQSEKASYMKMHNAFNATRNAASFQIPLYIIPSRSTQSVTEDLPKDYFEARNTLYDAWYGDHSEEIKEAQQEVWSIYSNRIPHHQTDTSSQANTLMINRATSVAQYLQSKLDPAIADTVFVQFRSNDLQSKYTPEERFYARSVEINIQYFDPREYAWDKKQGTPNYDPELDAMPHKEE